MTSTLILLRHGQSTWNLENVFTGWTDVPLSPRGVEEAKSAGRLMLEAGLLPTIAHTSVLRRAFDTLELALGEMELGWIPVRIIHRMSGSVIRYIGPRRVSRPGLPMERRPSGEDDPALSPLLNALVNGLIHP